jgi:hypothetical protein
MGEWVSSRGGMGEEEAERAGCVPSGGGSDERPANLMSVSVPNLTSSVERMEQTVSLLESFAAVARRNLGNSTNNMSRSNNTNSLVRLAMQPNSPGVFSTSHGTFTRHCGKRNGQRRLSYSLGLLVLAIFTCDLCHIGWSEFKLLLIVDRWCAGFKPLFIHMRVIALPLSQGSTPGTVRLCVLVDI